MILEIRYGRIGWKVGKTRRIRRAKLPKRIKKQKSFQLNSKWMANLSKHPETCIHYYRYTSSFDIIDENVITPKNCRSVDASQPLSRVIPIPKSQLTAYRAVIIMRLIILALFFQYRVTHPVDSAFGLWLTSVICEIWFAFSWVLDQFPKWCPINRETFTDRLSARSLLFHLTFFFFFT